jgi:hypothetical protein
MTGTFSVIQGCGLDSPHARTRGHFPKDSSDAVEETFDVVDRRSWTARPGSRPCRHYDTQTRGGELSRWPSSPSFVDSTPFESHKDMSLCCRESKNAWLDWSSGARVQGIREIIPDKPTREG